MKQLKKALILICILPIFSSCNHLMGNCPPNAIIEWVDLVKINDVEYNSSYSKYTLSQKIEQGKLIGKVKYQLADQACSNHKLENGDAAFLEKGTPIYEVKGYPASLLVTAENKIYVVNENSSAKKVGDLYPIKELVKNIYIESTNDGKRLKAFSEVNKTKFLEQWLTLKLRDKTMLYREEIYDGKNVFLGIELNNGFTFREVYWVDSNVFRNGVKGNDEIKRIFAEELMGLEEKKAH